MVRKHWTIGKTFRRSLVSVLFLGSVAPAFAADDNADLVKKGEYLVTAGDCVACHTAPGGEKFAGNYFLPTPVGKIPTPNLTPDKETGIGNWTDDQFYRAIHEGIGNKGEYLYPALPFPWFTKVTREDAMAIKAYLFSLKPVHNPRKPLEIGFPFDIRTGLLTWRLLFFKEGTFEPDPKATPAVNRGAYLVEGLGHCGACHNRDNMMGASVWSGKLQGGKISGWYAPNITSDGRDGVGRWPEDDIVKFLKTGERHNAKTVALGPMHEVIYDSTSHMSDEDLHAIASYLKATAAKQTISDSSSSKDEPGPACRRGGLPQPLRLLPSAEWRRHQGRDPLARRQRRRHRQGAGERDQRGAWWPGGDQWPGADAGLRRDDDRQGDRRRGELRAVELGQPRAGRYRGGRGRRAA